MTMLAKTIQSIINVLFTQLNPHVKKLRLGLDVKVTGMFGWILKTNWNIGRLMYLYKQKKLIRF